MPFPGHSTAVVRYSSEINELPDPYRSNGSAVSGFYLKTAYRAYCHLAAPPEPSDEDFGFPYAAPNCCAYDFIRGK
jgi:hypothetical protein